MPPSTRHQYCEALLRKQQPTNNGDIYQHKSYLISTHYARNQAEKLSPPNHCNREIANYFRTYQSIPYHSSSPRKMTEKFSFKYFGIAFFLGASLFCLYYIWTVPSEPKPSKYFTTQLKLVSVFNRHGDRAPSDEFPKGDRHAENINLFWPNGQHNLTDVGRFRQFRIGLELRRKYNEYLGFNSSNVIAFSSSIYRCIESLEQTLRGLYNTEWTKEKGRSILGKCNTTDCFGSGSGSPDEWRLVPVDQKTVPSLVYDYLSDCKYRKENPSPIDFDLMSDPEIKSLVGVEQLKTLIQERYNQNFSYPITGIWSTIASEMSLVRTKSTIEYANHYADWVNKPVSNTRRHSDPITLYDLHEQVNVLTYRDRVVDEARYIQLGPILTSLIESQLVALGHNSTNDRMKTYKDKKMIFYSSHDSILQLLLSQLGLINIEGNFQSRFEKWHKSHDEVGKFLSGLKMCSYGLSVRFELLQMEVPGKTDKFSYVRAYIYNKEDPKFEAIDYKPVEFGSACRRVFEQQNPNASSRELLRFYNPVFQVDFKYSCPFDLLRNVTANMMIDEQKIHRLCGY